MIAVAPPTSLAPMSRPEENPRRQRQLRAALGFVVPALALGLLLHDLARPQFVGDGYGYYAPLASLAFQGDLDLRDELAPVGPALLRAMFLTPDGRLGDPFPVGPSILWAPAVLVAKLLPAPIAPDAGAPRARRAHPGFAPRFARAVLGTNVVLVLASGALLAVVLAAQVAPWAAAIALLAAVFGTPTVFYVLADPSYGHAPAFAAVTLLVAMALVDRRRPLPLVWLGTVWGLVALVRWQDAVLGLLFAPRLLTAWRAQPSTLRRRAALAARFLVPALLVFTPQMLFWWRIYGSPFLRPPGAEFLPFWRPQVLPLLFSTWNGAFVWSPLLLVGLAGWWRYPERALRLAVLGGVVLEIYVCALVLDWWGGRGIGARRLVSLAPLAAVGLAFLLGSGSLRTGRSRLRLAAGILILAAGCMWNLRLGQYQLRGMLPFNPGNASDYVRWHAPGSPPARRYGYWDYPRLLAEIAESERMLRIDRRR